MGNCKEHGFFFRSSWHHQAIKKHPAFKFNTKVHHSVHKTCHCILVIRRNLITYFFKIFQRLKFQPCMKIWSENHLGISLWFWVSLILFWAPNSSRYIPTKHFRKPHILINVIWSLSGQLTCSKKLRSFLKLYNKISHVFKVSLIREE